jgi:hypothetical protein
MRTFNFYLVSGRDSVASNMMQFLGSIGRGLINISRRLYLAWILRGVILLFGIKVFMIAFTILFPFFRDSSIPLGMDPGLRQDPEGTIAIDKKKAYVNQSIRQHEMKLARMTPNRPYLVINTTLNRFYLYDNRRIVREGICSTGSYIRLEAHNRQSWIFKTPKGAFRIQGKTVNPVWRKPDWAFIEEGLPIPAQNHRSRFEYGVLGDYALSLGNGYLIHGTLYQRLLGLPVTHGCVRMNDGDLEEIYRTLQVGSRVYIY